MEALTQTTTSATPYESLSNGQLRSLIRDRGLPAKLGLSGVDVACLPKPRCIEILVKHDSDTGSTPQLTPASTHTRKSGKPSSNVDDVARGIAELLTAGIDRDELREIVKQTLAELAPRKIEYSFDLAGTLARSTGRQHFYFPLLVALLSVKGLRNIALTGPAGSGKSTLVIEACKLAGLTPYIQPPMDSKVEAKGYMSATGGYVESIVYKAMSTPNSALVLEEFDGSDPRAALVLNTVTANGRFTFPNGETIECADNFKILYCMNTAGIGATNQYLGRNALDAATLDRFCLLHIPYDEDLEASFCGVERPVKQIAIDSGGKITSSQWLDIVQRVRRAISELKYQAVISPRASVMGSLLCDAGIGADWLKEMLLFKALTPEQIQQVKTKANLN